MRRNYISNSIFLMFLIGLICVVKFTGYFSASFLKDDFFYGAIVLPMVILFSIFGFVWTVLNYKDRSRVNILTSIISIMTTIGIAITISLLPQILLLMGNGGQTVLIGAILALVLFNVWIIEWNRHKNKR